MSDAAEGVVAIGDEISRLNEIIRQKDAEIARLSEPDMFWPWEHGENGTETPASYHKSLLGEIGPHDVLEYQAARASGMVFSAVFVKSVENDLLMDEYEILTFKDRGAADRCYPESLAAAIVAKKENRS